jgi:uncharacterized protein (TIGR02271 family)
MTNKDTHKAAMDTDDVTVLPLVEEDLHVGKREVVTGRVRVQVATDTIEQMVAQDLRGEEVDVERVPIGTYVENGAAAPQIRTEGDITVVPVLEEVLVVEKRLLLKEELRIRRRTTVEHTEVPVTLRKQRAEVERVPNESDDFTKYTNQE